MTKQNKATSSPNTSAPASPESHAEVLAAESAGVPSQSTHQAETGNIQRREAVNTSPDASSGSFRDEAHRAELKPVLNKPDESADHATALGHFGPTHIIVRSLKDGFRRAGRAWSKEPTTVPIDEFTDEQLQTLVTEPMLVIEPARV